jgi:hypothetical protein
VVSDISARATLRVKNNRHSIAGFHALAPDAWRKRKGGFVRRVVRRILIANYRLAGSPVVANTCCTGSLMSSGSSSASSIPLPT